jgi:hypothetical protein
MTQHFWGKGRLQEAVDFLLDRGRHEANSLSDRFQNPAAAGIHRRLNTQGFHLHVHDTLLKVQAFQSQLGVFRRKRRFVPSHAFQLHLLFLGLDFESMDFLALPFQLTPQILHFLLQSLSVAIDAFSDTLQHLHFLG